VSARLALAYGGVDYLDRTQALASGEVRPLGVELNFQSLPISELFRRVCQHAEFDAAELSLSSYMIMRARGDERFVAIPVFPARAFRQRQIYVGAGSGIKRPEDLAGRTVGLREYQITAAVWIRAFLQHDYGVEPSSIRWRYGGVETSSWAERLEHPTPQGIELERIPPDRSLVEMLEHGELDALAATHAPKAFLEGRPWIRRLFPDYRPVEEDYFRRTGLFPIMHTVVIRRDVYDEHRWFATSLLNAFEEAKAVGQRRLRDMDVLAVSDPWWEPELERVDALFAGDPFPYGYARNEAALGALTQYSYEQGLSPRRLDPRELFAPETLET
jgi:4,5-dihydroxyphthalate decarboxylase